MIVISNCSNDNDINNPEKRNENWCWFIDQETGQGKWITIGEKTTVKNGAYTLFFCNGNIRQTGKLKDGVDSDTIYTYDTAQILISKLVYLENDTIEIMSDGKYKGYYSTCELLTEGEFMNNKQVGPRIEYYKNGNPSFKSIPMDDTTWLYEWYYENGHISERIFEVNDLRQDTAKFWHQNGNLSAIHYYELGLLQGESLWFHENGAIAGEANFIDDKEEGLVFNYYPTGELHGQGSFVKGREHGLSFTYYESGQVRSKINYQYGKMEGESFLYFENGQIESQSTWNNNNAEYVKVFDESGNVLKEGKP